MVGLPYQETSPPAVPRPSASGCEQAVSDDSAVEGDDREHEGEHLRLALALRTKGTKNRHSRAPLCWVRIRARPRAGGKSSHRSRHEFLTGLPTALAA